MLFASLTCPFLVCFLSHRAVVAQPFVNFPNYPKVYVFTYASGSWSWNSGTGLIYVLATSADGVAQSIALSGDGNT